MTAPLTNYDRDGRRWSACRTIRVNPLYPVNPPPAEMRPDGYEVYDLLAETTRTTRTLAQAREQVADLLATQRHPLQWQEWETFGAAWRSFTTDGMVEVRALMFQDANQNGLYGVGIFGCGPVRTWLCDIRDPAARRANIRSQAEHFYYLEATR